jgi:imidazolonepropionase-like amidohydrolase
MRRAFICLLCVVSLLAPPASRAQSTVTAVVGATLVNPDSAAPLPDAVILVRDGRILDAGPAARLSVPAGARVVDAKGKWIIPGLVDGHVHFFQSGDLYTRPDAIDLRKHRPYAQEEIARIRANLSDTFARYLRSGVTSVVDFGGPFWNFDVRDIAATTAVAPRVAVAGPLVSTYQPEALTTDDPPILKVKSAEEARALVRRQLPRRPDFIKIWYIVQPGEKLEDNLPIVKATIEEAHAGGVRVAVHATELETARAAVLAGADVLVHSVDDKEVDDAFVRLLKERNVVYVPTLMVIERYRRVFSQQVQLTRAEWEIANPWVVGTWFDLRHLPEADIPERARRLIRERQPIQPPTTLLNNLRRVHAAGVTVALGTDAGNVGTPHGPSVFREMELMREAGLSPREILADATINGARLMGRDKELGTIEAGKLADFVVLNADPLADVRNASDIHLVVKDGTVFEKESVLPQTPEEVVQRQVNAYNARDLDAFLATYGPDVTVFDHPATPIFAGLEQMRKVYGQLFERSPALHGQIVNRMVVGNRVIDHERVTGLRDRAVEAVAIYEVMGGLIRKVWFIRVRSVEVRTN